MIKCSYSNAWPIDKKNELGPENLFNVTAHCSANQQPYPKLTGQSIVGEVKRFQGQELADAVRNRTCVQRKRSPRVLFFREKRFHTPPCQRLHDTSCRSMLMRESAIWPSIQPHEELHVLDQNSFRLTRFLDWRQKYPVCSTTIFISKHCPLGNDLLGLSVGLS